MAKQYSKSHEWVEDIGGGKWRMGISAHAQEQLGDVVAVELPEVGRELSGGEECAVVESVKAAGDVYAPMDGVVAAVNEKLAEQPELVNSAPEGEGWLVEITADSGPDGWMDADAYAAYAADA